MTKSRKKNLCGTNEFKPPYLFYFKDASPACYSKVTSSKHKHARVIFFG